MVIVSSHRQCHNFTNVLTWNTCVAVGLYFIFRITDSYYALHQDGQYNQPACFFRAYCSLLNTSSIKNPNQHKRNRYDRDIQELSDEDNNDAEYQSGDFIRACVSHVDVQKEETQLTIDPSTNCNSFKRKQIPSDEYFDKLREKQDHEWAIQSVAEGVRLMKENDSNSAVLHFNKALITDPKCVDALVARGALSANQGHHKRAMQDFKSALQIDHLSIYTYVYKEECLSVCLFVMRLVPVIASVTKLSMALP